MKILGIIGVPLLCAAAAAPADIDALIAAARVAPAEFAADALIRIAAIDSLDRTRRVELLEQSFERASGAQQRYKRTVSFSRLFGAASLQKKVYAQDLDGLSLKLRAIEGMLPLDARKSLEM